MTSPSQQLEQNHKRTHKTVAGCQYLNDPTSRPSTPSNQALHNEIYTAEIGRDTPRTPSPALPQLRVLKTTRMAREPQTSSDPLNAPTFAEFSARSHRPLHPQNPQENFFADFHLSATPASAELFNKSFHPSTSTNSTNFKNRKQCLPANTQASESRQSKRHFISGTQKPTTANINESTTARELIFQSRDLLVQAYTCTKSRDEQAKILDLLDVFREFTETGHIQKVSKIIASQVCNLETAIRQFEAKAKAPAKAPTTNQQPTGLPAQLAQLAQPTQPTQPAQPAEVSQLSQPAQSAHSAPPVSGARPSPSYASVAGTGQKWTLVTPKTRALKPEKTSDKSHRLILVRSVPIPPDFSPLALRNAFNQAFANKGVKGPVVNTVTKTLSQNLVVSTTSQFSADFLLEKESIWKHLIPFQSAKKDETWHKVVLHGIPTADFNVPHGMELVIEEIKTFNKGLTPVGTPYWLTTPDKRANQRAGSVVVAFATANEASQAIRNRVYIAGISVRVEKLHSTAATTQCSNCQGFGHLENHCKYPSSCQLCGENHATKQHLCKTCSVKGARCPHLVPQCTNCKESHTADHKACETLLAIKAKKLTSASL